MYRACQTCRRYRPYGHPAQIPRRRHRQDGRRARGTGGRRAPPQGITMKPCSCVRPCVSSLRGQENKVDCGHTCSLFRGRGLAGACAAPRQRIRVAGHCYRGGGPPPRMNRIHNKGLGGGRDPPKQFMSQTSLEVCRRYVNSSCGRQLHSPFASCPSALLWWRWLQLCFCIFGGAVPSFISWASLWRCTPPSA